MLDARFRMLVEEENRESRIENRACWFGKKRDTLQFPPFPLDVKDLLCYFVAELLSFFRTAVIKSRVVAALLFICYMVTELKV